MSALAFKQFRQYKYLQTSIVNISFPNLPLLLNKNNKGTGKQPVIKSNRPEVFLRKGILKICSKFTGEHPCRSDGYFQVIITPRNKARLLSFKSSFFKKLLWKNSQKSSSYWAFLQIVRPTLLREDSVTGDFMEILLNFSEQLLLRTLRDSLC